MLCWLRCKGCLPCMCKLFKSCCRNQQWHWLPIILRVKGEAKPKSRLPRAHMPYGMPSMQTCHSAAAMAVEKNLPSTAYTALWRNWRVSIRSLPSRKLRQKKSPQARAYGLPLA